MKGYNTLRQMIEDYKLYHFAKEHDPRKRKKDSVTCHLKMRIVERRKKATKRFKQKMKSKGYTDFDLELVAVEDRLDDIYDLHKFLRKLSIPGNSSIKIKKIMQSAAFKNNKLRSLEMYVPYKIENKQDLLDYIHTAPHMGSNLLSAIISCVAPREWRSWLADAIRKGEIRKRFGGWI